MIWILAVGLWIGIAFLYAPVLVRDVLDCPDWRERASEEDWALGLFLSLTTWPMWVGLRIGTSIIKRLGGVPKALAGSRNSKDPS